MRALKKTKAEPLGDPERELSYDIAEQVFALRAVAGLTQGELAEQVGTKQPTISSVESAKKLPTLGLLLRIATALNRRLVIRFEKPGDTK